MLEENANSIKKKQEAKRKKAEHRTQKKRAECWKHFEEIKSVEDMIEIGIYKYSGIIYKADSSKNGPDQKTLNVH